MERQATIRRARRQDTVPLADLRVGYLAEMARLEPRLQLLPDVRERTEHALPVWMEHEERVLLVAETVTLEGAPTVLLGYATGVAAVWPPVLRQQHVGEVQEVYVRAEERGKGYGRDLLRDLTRALRDLGSGVLRASVPAQNEDSLGRFRALGYTPLQLVLQRGLEEG